MSKKNDDFFKEKKPWSEVKDQLLGCYFKPYLLKILQTKKPVVYVDCFAGKGKFEDGNPGSPLIALGIIDECLASTNTGAPQISTTFIDVNYAEDLQRNIGIRNNSRIVSGKYEEQITEILKGKTGCNVFLYIDPYGIKALKYSMFNSFAKGAYNSIELLINMNSFGFIREACHALGAKLELDDPNLFDDLIEYAPAKMDASNKSIEDLNEIAGGDYWQAIIQDLKANKIDGYQAEELFAAQYCQELMRCFKFVLNMPLRIKQGQRPKYRMIHATNHQDGCLLMVDNICNRWEAWHEVQNAGQMSLFEEDANNQIVDESEIEAKMMSFFSRLHGNYVSLHMALAYFFMQYGPLCKSGVIKQKLKDFEKRGLLLVERDPKTTPTGRPATFMDEKTNQKRVMIKWASK